MQYTYTAQIHGKKFTSGKSNLTTGHIAAASPHMDGSMVLRAHWLHLVNTIELVLPSAHLSSQSKRQIDQFSRSCTAHSRKSYTLQWALLSPQNCLFPLGICIPI